MQILSKEGTACDLLKESVNLDEFKFHDRTYDRTRDKTEEKLVKLLQKDISNLLGQGSSCYFAENCKFGHFPRSLFEKVFGTRGNLKVSRRNRIVKRSRVAQVFTTQEFTPGLDSEPNSFQMRSRSRQQVIILKLLVHMNV